MSIERTGLQSLKGVNAWIGYIDSNLQNASRTAYKKTRPAILDGLGPNYALQHLEIPEPTLVVKSTGIEWEQGNILSSTEDTHFAINGEGFFVLRDKHDKYFASRDGEFHWDPSGYLVNSSGLRVVSQGQDYIRKNMAANATLGLPNVDMFDDMTPEGRTLYLQSYGNKSMMLAGFGNQQGLRFSAYGSTVFEIDGQIPISVRNDFAETTDGLAFAYADPTLGFRGTLVGPSPTATLVAPNPMYTHSLATGTVTAVAATDAVVAANRVARMQIAGAQRAEDFDLELNFNMTATVGGGGGIAGARDNYIAINFGMAKVEDSPLQSGFQLRYYNNGDVEILQEGTVLNQFAAAGPALIVGPPRQNLRVQINSNQVGNHFLNASLDGVTVVNNQPILALPEEITGYLAIENATSTITVDQMLFQPKHPYVTDRVGPMFMGNDPFANTIAPGTTNFTTAVVQKSLESSNAALVEFVPLLSVAQKVFSGVAKIISVFNSNIDDLNGLIR